MPDSRAASGSTPLWRALRVLVVDDESTMLRTIRRMLKRSRPDWKLVTVTSGELALEQLEQRRFHVMVTDLRMDGMQGHTLLKRARERYPELVCVVHSADAESPSHQRHVALAHGRVVKPASGETLVRAIEDALGFEAEYDEQNSA